MDEKEYDEYLDWVLGLSDIETWESNQVAADVAVEEYEPWNDLLGVSGPARPRRPRSGGGVR